MFNLTEIRFRDFFHARGDPELTGLIYYSDTVYKKHQQSLYNYKDFNC